MAIPLAPAASSCAMCGEPLNAKGDCLACLFRSGLEESVVENEPPVSLLFGSFEVKRRADGSYWELGHGAMGMTYLAVDTVLRRSVALKVIDVPAVARGSQAVRERFLREARAAAALRHPNVAAVFQFGASPDGSHCYYAMELVEGETLEARVQRDGPFKAGPTLEIAIQITQALMAAAAQGLIHRDLKPGNIMLTSGNAAMTQPDVKVIDFGLAKAIVDAGREVDLTHGGFVGTPNFASPEQFGSGPVDPRSDIYSLGATLWFALTGLPPRSGSTIEEIRDRQTHDDLPVAQLAARKVPEPIIKLLRSTLAVDPSNRPASARELMEALESCRRKLAHGIGSFQKLTALFVVLAIAAAFFMLQMNRQSAPRSAKNIAPSIAVLPFENLSEEKSNAYFAEGIQEQILARLAEIADLKVISRTSTQQYQSKPGNLREIAKQLGVANILEGSVQKSADQVRVHVQLINASTDVHLWAETYDRKLTDIFGVESEIAKRIAESLQAKLTGREEQALAVKPTNNSEAYDAYLRGLAFAGRSSYYYQNDLLEKAVSFYERAVQLDPNFALAWVRLCRANAGLYFTVDTTATRRDAAKRALDSARQLEPNSAETLLALASYQSRVLRDYGLAKVTFQRVNKMLPSSSETLSALAWIEQGEGHWDESIAYWEQALVLDPRNTGLLRGAARTSMYVRQFPAALKLEDRLLDILPNDPEAMAEKANIYQAEGNLEEAAKFLPDVNAQTSSPVVFETKITQLVFERNFGEAVRLRQARLTQFHFSSELDKGFTQFSLAFTKRLAGDSAEAKVTAEQARNTLEPLCKAQPDNAVYAVALSYTYACLGNKDAALKEAERAVALVPSARDALYGPSYEENLALVELILGENSRAIPTLARLLQTPYHDMNYATPITPAHLRLDPMWESARGDPAFQKLCDGKSL